jgi:hypothetical protein
MMMTIYFRPTETVKQPWSFDLQVLALPCHTSQGMTDRTLVAPVWGSGLIGPHL